MWELPPVPWHKSSPTAQELAKAEHEALTGAQFDRVGLKRSMWLSYRAGQARLVCLEATGLARIVAIVPRGCAIPLDQWGRIVQWFGSAPNGKPWTIYWFAAKQQRRFPGAGQDLGPEHVNGGYTVPCSTDGIFIYREEEATRVLVHEMLHAACLDEQEWTIPMREAMIETWAELILIALCSKGSRPKASALLAKQVQWIADSNGRAERYNGLEDISDYAWRYLTGRVQMYGRLGIVLPAAKGPHPSGSLRFTHPALEAF